MEAALVFIDVDAGIPIDGTGVEDFFAVEIADAAGAGAEAVDEPGNFVEGGELEYANVFIGAFGPAGGERGSSRGARRQRFAGFAALQRCFRRAHGVISIIAVDEDCRAYGSFRQGRVVMVMRLSGGACVEVLRLPLSCSLRMTGVSVGILEGA